MTQTAIRMTTTVLPGQRIEVTSPELTEGEKVELIVLRPEELTEPALGPEQEKMGIWDYIQSLPPSHLTEEEWARLEHEFREERDSWGD